MSRGWSVTASWVSESGPIHRPVDDPGCGEFSAVQGSDEGLCAPFAERGVCLQALAPARPAALTEVS
jgi:hypothetical protein